MQLAYSPYLSASDDITTAYNQETHFSIPPRIDLLALQAYLKRLDMPLFESPNLTEPFSACFRNSVSQTNPGLPTPVSFISCQSFGVLFQRRSIL